MSVLGDLVGVELGPTSWIDVPQERIDRFAQATGDPQWIHVDPERAADGPFGTTIAHGFLTLALCVPMLDELLPPGDCIVLNYGVNKALPRGGAVGRSRARTVPRSRDRRVCVRGARDDRNEGRMRGRRQARLRRRARRLDSVLTSAGGVGRVC